VLRHSRDGAQNRHHVNNHRGVRRARCERRVGPADATAAEGKTHGLGNASVIKRAKGTGLGKDVRRNTTNVAQ